jgi:O-antigen/teichoic acid export membrane protein
MRTKRLPFRKNFSWAFAGNAVYNFSQWGLIVVLAKLSTPTVIGQYTIALAVTGPIFMFSKMRLNAIQATDVQDRNRFGDYFGLRLITSFLALLLIGGIAVLGAYSQEVILIICLVAIAKFVESLSDASYGLMQKEERLDLSSRSLMGRGLISLITITIALFFTQSLAVALITQIVVWSSVLWFYDLRLVRRWQSNRLRFVPSTLSVIFWLALPLGIVSGLSSLSAQVPRYAIELFSGEHELGIFAAITALGYIASMMTLALSRSALPRLSRFYAEGKNKAFIHLILKLMGIGAVLGVLGMFGSVLFGKPFLIIIYTKEYGAYTNVLILTMANIGAIAAFTFLGSGLAAAKRFTIQTVIHTVKLISIVITCLILVPKWGIMGAAWATLIGTFVSGAAYGIILWQTIRCCVKEPLYEIKDIDILSVQKGSISGSTRA